MPETRLLDNQSSTCVTLHIVDDEIGNKLSSRFDSMDLKFEVIRREMNEGFNRLEYFLTNHWTNNVRLMIATNIAVLGAVIASLVFMSNNLK